MFNSNYLIKKSLRIFNNQSVKNRIKSKKPFWLGMAKSKKFIIRTGKKMSEEEETEIARLKKEYEIDIDSLYHFIKHRDTKIDGNCNNVSEEMSSHLQNKIMQSLAKNEIWNKESAKLRESRLKLLAEKNKTDALSKIEFKEKAKKKFMTSIEKIVLEEKIASYSYITLNNLDVAVDNCLNNVVDYNFAIDLSGKKYLGQKTLPTSKENDSSATSASV